MVVVVFPSAGGGGGEAVGSDDDGSVGGSYSLVWQRGRRSRAVRTPGPCFACPRSCRETLAASWTSRERGMAETSRVWCQPTGSRRGHAPGSSENIPIPWWRGAALGWPCALGALLVWRQLAERAPTRTLQDTRKEFCEHAASYSGGTGSDVARALSGLSGFKMGMGVFCPRTPWLWRYDRPRVWRGALPGCIARVSAPPAEAKLALGLGSLPLAQ